MISVIFVCLFFCLPKWIGMPVSHVGDFGDEWAHGGRTELVGMAVD